MGFPKERQRERLNFPITVASSATSLTTNVLNLWTFTEQMKWWKSPCPSKSTRNAHHHHEMPHKMTSQPYEMDTIKV